MDKLEDIKNRMIKKAATIWGVAPNEIETSFDPIISLLISACASEIEKISSEISDSQTRITERLIQLMTPDTVFGPKPAHAIIYSEPSEKTTIAKEEFQFYFKKKVTYNNTSIKYRNIYFSPVFDFKLVDASVKYIATGNNIFEVDSQKNQKTLFQDARSSLPSSTIYIGLSSRLGTIPLTDISFYFELLDPEDRTLFYHNLRNTKWSTSSNKIEIVSGFHDKDEKRMNNLQTVFSDVSSKSANLRNQTKNIYKKHYVSINNDDDNIGATTSLFEELESIITSNKVKIEENIRWIKIEFPTIISNRILSKAFVSLNCFPGLNRELCEFTYQLKQYVNIIPIKTESLFLDIKSITNTEGKFYTSSSKNNENEDKGTFVLRNSNIGKLDQRKAAEYLTNLISLLKDESASFSYFNAEFLQGNLKGLNQLISVLEKRVSRDTTLISETNYVSMKPYKAKDNLILKYWTTNGVEANNITSGSLLEVYKALDIKQKSTHLITTTFGGKDELIMEERLNSYRRALLSRDRVVTKEDVKAVVYEIYNDKIFKTEVQKGYTQDISLKKGLIQCIEILLYPNNNFEVSEYEWNSLEENLLLYLEENSTNVFPYKIKMVN